MPTTYPASELFRERQPCVSILIATEVGGFKLGQAVNFTFGAETKPLAGRIATFTCDWQGKPAVWIEVDGYSPTWRHLAPLADVKAAP